MSMDVEVFSSFKDALVFFTKLVSEYESLSDYFDVRVTPTESDGSGYGMYENTDEGVSVRLDRVQKDLKV